MRFELAGDWPVGPRTLPAASIITSGAHHGEIDMADVPKPLPLNARAMDEDGALQMLYWYEPALWHHIVFGPGIDRGTVIAKRWGRK